MEKFKNNLILLETSAMNSLSAAKEEVLNPSKKTKVSGIIGLILFIVLATTSFSFAETKLFDTVKNTLDEVYQGIFGISTALAILCVVIGLICAQLTTNQQKTAKWIDFVKKAVIIWLILNSLLFLFNWLSDLTKDGQIKDIKSK